MASTTITFKVAPRLLIESRRRERQPEACSALN